MIFQFSTVYHFFIDRLIDYTVFFLIISVIKFFIDLFFNLLIIYLFTLINFSAQWTPDSLWPEGLGPSLTSLWRESPVSNQYRYCPQK